MTLIQIKKLKQKISLCVALLFFSSLATAQTLTVSGTVTDAVTNEPLIGVSVSIAGTAQGTITDIDGKYTIQIQGKNQLIFKYIGYETLRIAANTGILNIKLEPQAFEIEDVVVVGTRMKKSDLTGAIGGINEKQLREVPSIDLTTSMQGKVPGLFIARKDASPGADITVKVRGTNSINHGQEPVYVVDGMVVDQGLKLINPDDIASIEVLKDASSTALYGSRASNGVVVITTKKGQKGQKAAGDGQINYNGFVTVSQYQNRMKQLNARQLFELRLDAYANAYMDANPGASRQEYIDNILSIRDDSNPVFSPEELENGENGITSDWVDPLIQTGITQNHSLSFSGAADKTTYYLGFTYSGEDGLIKNTGYKRYGGKVSLEQQVKSWLKVGTNTLLSQGTRNILGGDEGNPFLTAYKGNPLQTMNKDKYYMYWQGVAQMGEYNPLLSLDIQRQEVHNRVLSSNYVEINPFKDFFFRSTFAVDIFNKQDNRYIPSYTGQSARDAYEGMGWQWRSNDLYWQWDNAVNYEKTFGKHRLFGLLSTSISRKSFNSVETEGFKFPFDDLGYHNMGFASNKELNKIKSDYKNSTLVSFIGRVNYSYASKYLLTATVRRDGSSKFAEGNKWGTFPSFSGAWNIQEEDFMSQIDYLSQLKLRAGFGIVGNQNIPEYAYLTLFNPQYSDGQVGLTVDGADNKARYENKDIRWEQQQQWNVGLDAGFWSNRLTFSVDVFSMINTDLLMNMNLYPSFGYDYKIANVAELRNQGVEFNLNALLLKTKDFSWSVSGNIAHDKNKITKLFDGVDVIWNGGNVTDRENHLFVGQSLNSIYAYELAGIAQLSDQEYLDRLNAGGNIEGSKVVRPGDYLPKDQDGDGRITYLDDMLIVGKKDPRFYGGFSTYLTYRNFSLDAVFSYSYGAKRISYVYEGMINGTGTSIASTTMLDRWTPENPSTAVPRAWRGSGESRFNSWDFDISAMDASFLRCAAITLAYDVPKSFLKKYIGSMRIYANAGNLFLITPYKGYDPETGEDYPLNRSFTVGLNLSF